MSHFAKIQNGRVSEVIVAEQNFIDTLDGTWVQCSYNTYRNVHKLGGTPLRGNFPSFTYHYDSENDVFYRPQPYPCLLYTSPSPRDRTRSRMPSSA